MSRWVSAVALLTLVGGWVASGWMILTWNPIAGGSLKVQLARGELVIQRSGGGVPAKGTPPHFMRVPLGVTGMSVPTWLWKLPRTASSPGVAGIAQGASRLYVPLWVVALVPVAAQGLAWWPRRRAKGACVTCGYDLTGTPSAPCPECGQVSAG